MPGGAKKMCLSGSKAAKLQTGIFGMGGSYSRHNADRLFKKLVLENILMEDLYITNGGQAVSYISAGPKALNLLSGHMQVTCLAWRDPKNMPDYAQRQNLTLRSHYR